jgi:hypothetical protein
VAEPRLGRRYTQLVMGQLSPSDQLAAGVHAPPGLLAGGFASAQAAWRFYGNERVKLPELAEPLLIHARQAVADCCDQRLLVVMDWSNLHYGNHDSKHDRVDLSSGRDLGYELLTALALSDRDGSPLAPVCLELRADDGLHSTRSPGVLKAESVLDGLAPVMKHVDDSQLGRPAVFIIDKEADSIAHYRAWSAAGREFLIRANDTRRVTHNGQERKLNELADELRPTLKQSRQVRHKGKPATQLVTETTVLLTRPAYENRTVKTKRGKAVKKRRVIPGAPVAMRLIIAEVRDNGGKVLARWLLLTNVPASIAPAQTIALWYYWRWRIESYHKLLKGTGQHVEQWRQETALATTRRLLVTAMAAVITWHIARDTSPEIEPLRQTLIKLSGRQTDRARNPRGFTEPMLLAGLNVLIPMMLLLETMSVSELRQAAGPIMPLIQALTRRRSPGSG